MSNVIHGDSHKALRFMRKHPATLAVLWIFASRTNYENVAYPSLRGLSEDTGWSVDECAEARDWLVEQKALVEVTDYIRPEWRELPKQELTRKLNFDKAQYYRPTGQIAINDEMIKLLYFGTISDVRQQPTSDSNRHQVASDVRQERNELKSTKESFTPDQSSNTKRSSKDSAPKNGAVKKPAKTRPDDPIFDAVKLHIFGITDTQAQGGRIGKISNWLKGKYQGSKGREVGYISAPVEIKHIIAFAAHCKAVNMIVPLDFVKFVENWRKWASTPLSIVDTPREFTPTRDVSVGVPVGI